MSQGSRVLNRLRVLLDHDLTAANAIDKALAAHPERRLFHLETASGYDLLPQHPTVREIHRFVTHVGQCLLSAGLEPHDRVVIYKTNRLDYFFLALAIIRVGGIAVPINSRMPLDIVRQYAVDLGARFVCADARHFGEHIGDAQRMPDMRCWLFDRIPDGFSGPAIAINAGLASARDSVVPPVHVAPEDVVMMVHTSGTTDIPKSVLTTSRGIVAGIKGHIVGEPIPASNRIGIAGHFSHLVCNLGLFTSLLGNLEVWELVNHVPGSLLAQIQARQLNVFFAFPDLYLAMFLHGLDAYDLSSVKVWIATADASHQVHMKAFCRKGAALKVGGRKLVEAVFIEPLGTSEVGFAAIEGFVFPWTRTRTDRRLGWPTPGGPKVFIGDEHGAPVPPDRPGRLMVKGPTLFAGYWDTHGRSLDGPRDGWWWTGDIVARDRLGRYYHLDRAVDVICTANGAVYSLPLEERILQHAGVGEVAVVGLQQPGRGTVPVAIVHARPGVVLDADEVRQWANRRLDRAAQIAAVILVEPAQIPRGLTGKVLKRQLRQHFASYFLA